MSESDIATKVKQIISSQLGIDVDKISDNQSFADDLGADSLDLVEMVMAFEEAFGIEIPEEVASKIKTVADAIRHISEANKK